jgi:uncharacterized membrane protein
MLNIRELIEVVSMGIEILAVLIMVSFIIFGTTRWVLQSAKNAENAYERYRLMLGRALLIGLELLVAADIILTIALDQTALSLGLLGALVVVRTFLGWSIIVEIEGRWPWQKEQETRSGTT